MYQLYKLIEGKRRARFVKSFNTYNNMLAYLKTVSHSGVWFKFKLAGSTQFHDL